MNILLKKFLMDIPQKKKNKQPINIEKIDQPVSIQGQFWKYQITLEFIFQDK